MTAGRLRFIDKEYAFARGDTVLDCLERSGLQVASSCHLGSCGVCVLQMVAGEVPEQAQHTLHSGARARGHFLACRCPAKDALHIKPIDVLSTVEGRIESVEPMAHSVLRVQVRISECLHFQAGQVIHLVRPEDGLFRPFVVASLPEAPCLELHVERHEHGAMSSWLAGAQGEAVTVQGPLGDCFYLVERHESLLLVGSGVGAAAVLGVVRAALEHEHRGLIDVILCESSTTGVCCLAPFEQFERHEKIRLRIVSGGQQGGRELKDVVAEQLPDLTGYRVYLAGDPALLRITKLRALSRGVSIDNLHILPFKRFRATRAQLRKKSNLLPRQATITSRNPTQES